MTGSSWVLRGNALALPLADSTVDLVVTSPPYFALRSYQDGGEHYDGQIGDEASPAEFVDALIAATREMIRVVKPTGSIWVNLGDKYSQPGKGERNMQGLGGSIVHKVGRTQMNRSAVGLSYGAPAKSLIGIPWRYALRCIDDLGLILRGEVIWSKPNGLPDSTGDRVQRSHEHWFHFTKEPLYYSALDEILVPHAQPDRKRADVFGGNSAAKGVRHAGPTVYTGPTDSLGKVPGSVWEIPSQPLIVPEHIAHAVCCGGQMRLGCEDGLAHYAAFPMEWPRRIIRGWAPAGGVVLDPFGGTGTTALVAKVLGRTGVSVDMSADYCRLAQWRTNDPDQIASAMQVKKPAKQTEGQVSMFDLFEDGAA
jgi:DNA modification methylase